MRILDYAIKRAFVSHNGGSTPMGGVLMRLALFLGVSVAVYVLIWLVAVFFVSRLIRIPF